MHRRPFFVAFRRGGGKSKIAKLETVQIYGHCRKFQISLSLSLALQCGTVISIGCIMKYRSADTVPITLGNREKANQFGFLIFFSSSFNTSFRLSTRCLLHDVKVEWQFLKAQQFNSEDKWPGDSSRVDRCGLSVVTNVEEIGMSARILFSLRSCFSDLLFLLA